MENNRFEIDFFELLLLAEYCFPPTTIARASFIESFLNDHYLNMTSKNKLQVWERFNRLDMFKETSNDRLSAGFKAKFDPNKQYRFILEEEKKEAYVNASYEEFSRYYITEVGSSKISSILTQSPLIKKVYKLKNYDEIDYALSALNSVFLIDQSTSDHYRILENRHYAIDKAMIGRILLDSLDVVISGKDNARSLKNEEYTFEENENNFRLTLNQKIDKDETITLSFKVSI